MVEIRLVMLPHCNDRTISPQGLAGKPWREGRPCRSGILEHGKGQRMGPTYRSLGARYGFAVLAVVVALLTRLALDHLLENRLPFLLFSLAVVAVAWHGGFGPSLLTLVCGIVAAAYFFIPPRYSLRTSLEEHPIQSGGFLFLGVAIGLFSERLRVARRRAEAHTQEAVRQRHELEQEVARRQRLEQELQQRAVELGEADRRKDEFLAMLAHELRNPLAPIRNAVEVMKVLAPADAHLRQAREMIERQVKHLARLVDDLLDVSRFTTGKIKLHRAAVELATVIARAVETSRPLIDARGHKLEIALPLEPIRVEADTTRLAQVVGNLLNNAAKYTEKGGHIRLTVEPERSGAVVRVRDNGMGIAADLLPQVFDLFTQGDRSLARSEGGLGIGLTLVKSLVEMHGGRVEAHSAGANRGSEFVVWLPTVAASSALSAVGGESDLVKPQFSRSRRVLVVDDNADAAESLAMLLKAEGHEVSTAHDGLAALEAAEATRPEAVLLDIGLPRMDGYEVARRLREQGWLPRALLVAVTGYGQEEDRRRVAEAGFDAYLVKPADPAAVQKLLAGLEANI
jgi:signal transduction histidine kinase/CheY-like chemotaxis protein